MLEATIKKHVKERLKELGAYQHWPVQNGMGSPCLDCHGCYKVLYFEIETKRPGKKPTKRQDNTIDQIIAAGGIVLVIDTPEKARGITFDDYLKAKQFGSHSP